MELYIEFIGTLQNSGFWLVKGTSSTNTNVQTAAWRQEHVPLRPNADVRVLQVEGPYEAGLHLLGWG